MEAGVDKATRTSAEQMVGYVALPTTGSIPQKRRGLKAKKASQMELPNVKSKGRRAPARRPA